MDAVCKAARVDYRILRAQDGDVVLQDPHRLAVSAGRNKYCVAWFGRVHRGLNRFGDDKQGGVGGSDLSRGADSERGGQGNLPHRLSSLFLEMSVLVRGPRRRDDSLFLERRR